jgi:hypothetical protein
MNFDSFELVKQYDNMIVGKYPLRLYRSRFMPDDTEKPIESYRYHLGFPKKLIAPFCPLIESTPFWGEQHWTEHEDFYVWWTMITEGIDVIPYDRLDKEVDWRIKTWNKVLAFYKRAGTKQ